MTVSPTVSRRQVTRADWAALREQCARVRAENVRIREDALQARSLAVEQRLHAGNDRLERRARPAAAAAPGSRAAA